jgi:cytochrome c-type biogenesis protein CcmH
MFARSAGAASLSGAASHAAHMGGTDMPGMDMSNMNMPATGAAGANTPLAQQSTPASPQQQAGANGGVVDMEGDYYKPVRLPPKPGAKAQLTPEKINDFERTIACPCPCTLDVFTCRTTDFSCGNSPAVHRDVKAMVEGGYNADEILKALTNVYGNNILMAPPKTGINLVAWFAPFAALGAGAILLNAMLRGWRRNAQTAASAASAASPMHPSESGATSDELARLRAAMRDDS